MEIGWRWFGEGEQRCDGEGAEWDGVVGDPLAIWYLTNGRTIGQKAGSKRLKEKTIRMGFGFTNN